MLSTGRVVHDLHAFSARINLIYYDQRYNVIIIYYQLPRYNNYAVDIFVTSVQQYARCTAVNIFFSFFTRCFKMFNRADFRPLSPAVARAHTIQLLLYVFAILHTIILLYYKFIIYSQLFTNRIGTRSIANSSAN